MRMTAPVMTPPGLLSPQHPVWMCAMRPFFLLTMGSAVLLIGLWSAVLALGLPPPPVAGGALVWRCRTMLAWRVLSTRRVVKCRQGVWVPKYGRRPWGSQEHIACGAYLLLI